MSEVKKIATRESYGETLVELGAEHEEIVVLDADLAAATKTGLFQAAYPERFINWQQDWRLRVKFRLQVPSQCLRRDGLMSR